jgi:hypothetical protein
MRSARVVLAIIVSLTLGASPVLAAASQTVTVSGTAKKEAKRPYTNYVVRARQVDTGQIAASVPLDGAANFALTGMTPASYLMELVNGQGKVVCTAGPFAASAALTGVEIDCDKKKPSAAWLLLGAAGAAGITAAVLASPSDNSNSNTGATGNVAAFGAPPASPSR